MFWRFISVNPMTGFWVGAIVVTIIGWVIL